MQEFPKEKSFTPEAISVGSARISRDLRPIEKLVEEAAKELDEMGKSARNLISIGHHSVADHATLNIGISGISRFCVEYLEARRIGCGYTENSQRYIRLKKDYIIPEEFSANDKIILKNLVEEEYKFYEEALQKLIQYQYEKNPELAQRAKKATEKGIADKYNAAKNRIEGLAKEDARYVLSLCYKAKVSVTYNARTLEHAIRLLKYDDCREARELSKKFLDIAKQKVPNLTILANPEYFKKMFKGEEVLDSNFEKTRRELELLATETYEKYKGAHNIDAFPQYLFEKKDNVTYMKCHSIDASIIAAILFINAKHNPAIEKCCQIGHYLALIKTEGKEFMKKALKHLTLFDAVPREFEFAEAFKFRLVISSACFGQLKRHRIMTLLSRQYDTSLGVTVPESIKEVGLEQKFMQITGAAGDIFRYFEKKY